MHFHKKFTRKHKDIAWCQESGNTFFTKTLLFNFKFYQVEERSVVPVFNLQLSGLFISFCQAEAFPKSGELCSKADLLDHYQEVPNHFSEELTITGQCSETV